MNYVLEVLLDEYFDTKGVGEHNRYIMIDSDGKNLPGEARFQIDLGWVTVVKEGLHNLDDVTCVTSVTGLQHVSGDFRVVSGRPGAQYAGPPAHTLTPETRHQPTQIDRGGFTDGIQPRRTPDPGRAGQLR